MSYANLILYSAATPSYDDEKSEESKFDARLDANDPDNFAGGEEEIIVRA